MLVELLPLLGIIVAAYAVQTSTGFGAGVITLTLGASLFTVEELIALMVPLSLTQTTWVAWRERESISWDWLRWVFPLMGGGMIVAFWALSGLGDERLKPAFGVMVLLLAARELIAMRRPAPSPTPSDDEQPASRVGTVVALLGAGVVHGVYACGGPLLVYATGREGLAKESFRSTITTVWVVLGVALLLQLGLARRLSAESLTRSALLVPAIPVGILIGDRLFARVDERRFRAAVNVMLVLAAIALIVNR